MRSKVRGFYGISMNCKTVRYALKIYHKSLELWTSWKLWPIPCEILSLILRVNCIPKWTELLRLQVLRYSTILIFFIFR
jgi:hypothetical protein